MFPNPCKLRRISPPRYRQRWQIEILFRAWKQAGALGEALDRKSSPQHLKALVLAGMISLAIGLVVGIQLAPEHPGERYSMEKIFDHVINRLPGLSRFDDFLAPAPDPRYLQGQKRIRKSLCQSLMEFLS